MPTGLVDGTRITLLQSCAYGDAGRVLVVSPFVAKDLIAKGVATQHANQDLSEPAIGMSADAKSKIAAVLEAAGVTVGGITRDTTSGVAFKPVPILMKSSGQRILVHHDVAIQKLLGGHATLTT